MLKAFYQAWSSIPIGIKWLFVGYAAPTLLVGGFLVLIRTGPAGAHSYNYALFGFVVLLLCLAVAAMSFFAAAAAAMEVLLDKPRRSGTLQHFVLLISMASLALLLWFVFRYIV